MRLHILDDAVLIVIVLYARCLVFVENPGLDNILFYYLADIGAVSTINLDSHIGSSEVL